MSSNNSRYVYNVPDKASLVESNGIHFVNESEEIIAEFSLLQSLVIDLLLARLAKYDQCHY